MKKFLSLYTQNMKEMRKFWINQFTISVFGVMITWPCMAIVGSNDENNFVLVLATLFAGGFFCFLEYDVFFQRAMQRKISTAAVRRTSWPALSSDYWLICRPSCLSCLHFSFSP